MRYVMSAAFVLVLFATCGFIALDGELLCSSSGGDVVVELSLGTMDGIWMRCDR